METQHDPARLDRLRTFLQQDSNNPSLLTEIAWLELQQDQVDRAFESASKAAAISPDLASIQVILGLCEIRRGNWAVAAGHLKRALERGDHSSITRYHHAYALITLGSYAEAEESAAAAAEHLEEYPFAPALYLRTLHHLGKISEAIAYAEKLSIEGTAAPATKGMLSTLYLDNENLDKARDAAQAALAEDSEDLDAHTTMGLLALGDLDASFATAEFDQVLKKHSTHGRAMLGLGLSHMLAGDMGASIAALEKAVTATNMREHLGTWQTLAWCYILQKDASNAERTLKAAMELDRNFAETHGGMAIVALMKGNLDSAVQSAKRANNLDRNNFSGNFAQSLIEQVSGNAEQARAIVEHLLSQPVLPGGKTIQTAVTEMLAKSEGRRLDGPPGLQ